MISRPSALIIRDKKVLLVTHANMGDSFWTVPGGRINPDETDEQGLRREIMEEIGVELISMKNYLEFELPDRHVKVFLVEISGEPSIRNEIKHMFWLSRDDFEKKTIPIGGHLKSLLIPKLIQENLI